MKNRIDQIKETAGTTPIYIAKIAIEYGKRKGYCDVCNNLCNKDCMFYEYKMMLKQELYHYTGEMF